MYVCDVLWHRSEAETLMLEVTEYTEVAMIQFTKRRMELKTVIHNFAKLRTFMDRKLQEIIPLEEDEDSKKRSMIPIGIPV